MHSFECSYRCSCGASVKWEASWEMIGAADDTEGIRIHEKGVCYDVIIGSADYMDARLLIVPSLGVGVEVEDYTDQNHVEYRLEEYGRMDRHKAVTISNAISDYFAS